MKKRIVSVLLVLSLLAVLTVSVAQGNFISVDETMSRCVENSLLVITYCPFWG